MQKTHKRILLILLGIAMGIGLGAIQYFAVAKNNIATIATSGPIGAPLLLQKTDGTRLTDAEFKSKHSLVFFGFTHCPSFCPAALSTISDALAKLSQEKRQKLSVYFVSVDPKRDTRVLLAEYMQNFDPQIIALSGTETEIKKTLSDWKAYAAEVPEKNGGYTVDHSTFVYFVDPNFTLIKLFKSDDSAEIMAEVLNATL